MNNLLKITNLKKTYFNLSGEVETIKDLSFIVNQSDFIALVGPSGCGKSTILSIIKGLENKTSGNIEIEDNITIGYMLQQDCLCDWLNILDNCLLGLSIQEKNTNNNINKVIDLLIKYGLEEFMYDYPKNLSGGMRQRVALIRTLALNPDILLLDEPFSALDYQTRLTLSDEIYNIIKKEGKTAIMVTHDIAEAISMSDRIILLSKRPAMIKNIYNIDLENKKNPMENRKDKKFIKYYEQIWKEIDNHV